jgi:hypothetical protein
MLLSKGTLPLSFGTPMGNDKADAPQSGGTAGGVGSQCGMMNGMPWIVAAASKPAGERSPGALFGVFVNTLGWVHGTATPETSNRDAEVRGLFFLVGLVLTIAKPPSVGAPPCFQLRSNFRGSFLTTATLLLLLHSFNLSGTNAGESHHPH